MKLKVKPWVNKRNGQINISLPKKKLEKNIIEDIKKGKCIKLFLEEW